MRVRLSTKVSNFEQLKSALIPHHAQLQQHPVYSAVKSQQHQKVFMENHVWAVYDFMTLLKAIQIRVTCVSIPWTPPKNRQSAFLLNQMVMGEESDDLDTGDAKQATSHFELYMNAMQEVGADSTAIRNFVSEMENGNHWLKALKQTQLKHKEIHQNTYEFVESTLKTATEGKTHEIASSFLYGREDPIPKMFQQFLDNIKDKSLNMPYFQKYLERHIFLDADYHRPMAEKMLMNLLGNESQKFQEAYDVAAHAIDMRMHLWDGIHQKL